MERADIRPVKLVDGFRFMEGAAFDRDGFLYVVDGRQGLVARVDRDTGAWTPYCTTEGRPNGSAFHRDGRLFCADPGLKAIIEIPVGGGSYRIFADRCAEDGQPFRGPVRVLLQPALGQVVDDMLLLDLHLSPIPSGTACTRER